jgi:alkylated DNA nucleotide flippase Atl1
MAKKTNNKILNDSRDMPKIVDLSEKPKFVSRYGGTKMLIAAPLQYNEIMAKVPAGKIITSDKIRAFLANNAGADVTCPLTAGIFMNICAHASLERENDKIPYWRTVKSKGELNEKFPEGIDGQKLRLESEGHQIVQKGKKYFVKDYENLIWDIE